MTGADLGAALGDLGLTRAGFASKCGVETRVVYKWLRGDLPVPQYAVTIIELLRERLAAPSGQE